MKKLLLLLFYVGFITCLNAQENVIINNPATPVSYNVVYSGYYTGTDDPIMDSRDIGMTGGLTYHYSNASWPHSELYWGMDIADGAKISTEGPTGSEYTHTGTVLSLNGGSSNFSGGIAIFEGYTIFKCLNSDGTSFYSSTCFTRFTLTITQVTGVPISISSDGSSLYILADTYSAFNVNVFMEMLAPSGTNFGGITAGVYYPVIYLFDQMHTDPSDPSYSLVYTSFDHNFYSPSNVWFGYNTDWSDSSNWTDINRLPKSTDYVKLPTSPLGTNMPVIDDGLAHSIYSLSINPTAILTINSSMLTIESTGAK